MYGTFHIQNVVSVSYEVGGDSFELVVESDVMQVLS